ncbi:MAG: TonB-dependent receptor plug domain-containing protein [Pseudomonadota bacterium]
MKQTASASLSRVALGVLLALGSSGPALAQEQQVTPPAAPVQEPDSEEIEEVVVTGRFVSASQALVNERMTDAFATDLLGADTIQRLGDSTVAFALRRVPGLSLVQDRFVYIRGLGERYTTTTLNGAAIPSPDLSRNVIPLDVFPTSVVESLSVQKSYDPSQTANFGGGSVDIRTKGIPDAFTMRLELGTGFNTENPSRVATYPGGGDDNLGTDDGSRALSPVISDALVRYQGNPNVNNIFAFERRQDPTFTQFQAQTINRELAAALNRDIGVTEESPDPDITLRGSIGNRFLAGEDWELGFNVGGNYQSTVRWRQTRTAGLGNPEEQTGSREETTHAVNLNGTLNLGAQWLDDHTISTTTLYLRNTDNETEIFDFFNENRLKSNGRGFRDYRLEFEERSMFTNQIRGEHYLGRDTRERLPVLDNLLGFLPELTRFDWYYSTSEANTDIPSRLDLRSDTVTDRDTGEVLSEAVSLDSFAADYRFTDLDDEVENYAYSLTVPLEFDNSYLELSGGYDHRRKARSYYQAQFSGPSRTDWSETST